VTFGGVQGLSANLLAPPDGKIEDITTLLKTTRDWVVANEAAVKKVNLILGFGYDNATLAERRHPTREELDTISRDIPVLLIHQSSHFAALNSKALEIMGFTAETPDPAGGVIRRKAGSKEPDGVLEETAMQSAAMKLMGQVGADGVKVFFKAGTELWARFGYTTAQDGASTPGSVAVMRQVAAAGELKIDVVAYPTLTLDREIDASRGDVISLSRLPLETTDQFEATLVWMHEDAGLTGRNYDIKLATQRASASITQIKYRVNVNTLAHEASKQLKLNDIAECNIATSKPLAFEASRLAWLELAVEARLMTLSVVSPVPVYLRMFVPPDDAPILMVLFLPR
jgi:hypothetical protein